MTESSTKAKILFAAGEIFADRGFNDATVREICERADVNVASVNYHFGDKKSLYMEAVMAARETRVQQYPIPDWAIDTLPTEKLRDFIETFLNRLVAMESEPWQVRLIMREILNPTENCRELVQGYFRTGFGILASIIQEISRSELSEDELNLIGFSIIGQCLYYRLVSGLVSLYLGEKKHAPAYSKPELTHHVYQFSLAAILNYEGSQSDSMEAPAHVALRPNFDSTPTRKSATQD